MKMIAAFFSPTKIIVIDDNKPLVRSMVATMQNQASSDPRNTLIFEGQNDPVLLQRQMNATFTPDPYDLSWDGRKMTDEPLAFKMAHGTCLDLLNDFYKSQINEPAAVIVDFKMLGLNGLDFCDGLNNEHIQKILLTGHLNRNAAFEAFHDKQIHMFFKKDEERLFEKLLVASRNAQYDFFLSLTERAGEQIVDTRTKSILKDPVFFDFFQEQIEKLDIIKYCLVEKPAGFVLLDTKGKDFGLMVHTEEEFNEICCSGQFETASKRIQEGIKKRELMLCYHDREEVSLPDGSDWKAYVYPANKLQGRQPYYVAVAPKMFDIDRKKLVRPHMPSTRWVTRQQSRISGTDSVDAKIPGQSS